jgi:hypothetical protein
MIRLCSQAWLGRALILGLALSLAGAAQAAPPEKLLPDNTTMVFTINIKSLVESPLYQKALKGKLEELMSQNEKFADIMKTMNFDPMKDLTSVTTAIGDFSLNMQGGPPRPDVEPLIILKGNFDVAKMETALSALISAGGKDKVAISKIGERTMFEMKEGQKPMFGTFVDKETVVLADSKDKLQTAIDKSEGKKTAKLTKEFETALSKVDTKKSFWAALLVPESVRQMAGSQPQGAFVEKLESLNITVNVKDNLAIEMNGYMADADAAKEFKQILDQGKEMAGMFALNAPDEEDSKDIGDFISSIRIAANQKMVSLKGELKGSLIERAVKKAGKGGVK